MKYIVEYRVRALRGTRESKWREAQTFDKLEDAKVVKDDAIKYEAKGTKDWRVRAVQS
jgi:hypothetical protein